MRHNAGLAVFLATALASGAAMAATNATPPSNQTSSPTASASADANAMKGADALHHTNLRQELQDQLTKAGYTSIKIVPSAFYVQAKDKKGEPVAMVIGPDSFTEVTEVKTTGPAPQPSPQASLAPKK